MKTLKRFDKELYKFKPDQMVLRLNDVVDTINKLQVSLEQHSTVIGSKEVIIYGMQPDGTFGIAKWNKEGDTYANKVVIG